VLRLRGGGVSNWWVLTNKRDSQTTKLVLDNDEKESSELILKLATHLKIKED
jgi:hypothetical protein